MEFFGLTLHGPQNSLKDILKSNYKEPQSKEDVQLIMEEIIRTSTMPKKEKNTNVPNISISRSNKDDEETRFIFKLISKFACDVTDRYIVYVCRYILEIQRPDMKIIRVIDCYIGRVNGFAYGSSQRFNKMKRKGVIKPVGPADMFRLPPTTSIEYGWWQHDTALLESSWHLTHPRRPQPSSPNTLILDIVRKNNKYATLF